MSIITSPELIINMKSIPTPDSREYNDFVRGELKKLEEGVTINGVYIPNWLYWHISYWKLYRPVWDDRRKEVIDVFDRPLLRDNEWIIADALTKAKAEQKGIILVGARRLAKTSFLASWLGLGATIYEGSQNVIVGNNKNDIKNITSQMDKGLNAVEPFLRYNRIRDDWKNQVDLGFKYKKGGSWVTEEWSQIHIRNTEEGINTEVLAGLTPKTLVFDEIGKAKTKEVFLGSIPAYNSPYGWRCVPILSGCVCAGTKVWNKDGKLLNIEDLKQEDGLLGYNGDTIQKQKINWFKKPEKKECYRIYTDNGGILECSYDHPLLITKRGLYNKNKVKKAFYQEAKELKVKDQILIPSEVNVFGNKNISYARELGLLIGDGNYGLNSTPVISVSEKEIFDYLKPITAKYSKEYQISEDKYFADVSVPSLKNKLIEHGMYGQTKNNKRLPKDIHTFDRESCANLLGGYFDADGNVYYNKKKNITRIVLTSIVPELLEEVKYLLLKFGIVSCIIKEKRNTKPVIGYEGQQPYIYRLYINQQQDIELFKKNIKLLVKSKQDKLIVKPSKYKKFNCEFEINPLNNKEGYFNSNTLNDLRYTTITKIEHIGEQLVYNLNCGPNHNYLSNGFITRQTGGDMSKGQDANEMFHNPERYNLLAIDIPNEERKTGIFISGLMSIDVPKDPMPLSKYLNLETPSELDDVIIHVTNEEKGREIIQTNRENFLKANNQVDYLKAVMYAPLTPDECFMSNEQENPFPVEALKQHLEFLKRGGEKKLVRLYRDVDGKVNYAIDTKRFEVKDFPATKDTDKNAPVVMYEEPMANPPSYLYIAGGDPYNQNKSEVSPSLGTLYIYKRVYDPVSGTYQNRIVASYAARPETMKEWQETVEMLLELYNAICMIENEGTNFIQYMENKNKLHYLADGYNLAKEINPKTSIQGRVKGLPATVKIQNHYRNLILQYCTEKLVMGHKENGEPLEAMGLVRIQDEMLLVELINYRPKGNFDRLVAFGHCLIYDEYLQKIAPNVKVRDVNEVPQKKEPQIRSPFILNTRSNPFGI